MKSIQLQAVDVNRFLKDPIY